MIASQVGCVYYNSFGKAIQHLQMFILDLANEVRTGGRGPSDVELALVWHAGSYSQGNAGLVDGRHFCISGFLTLPTGTRTTAEYLFEPTIGNGHHWELGIEAYGYVPLPYQCNECETFALALSGRVGHLFAAKQKRSFDLTNGRGSRYMLLETIGTSVDDIVQIPGWNSYWATISRLVSAGHWENHARLSN